jgi:peptidoglycan/LPS O-acetylase OafA/YrhL
MAMLALFAFLSKGNFDQWDGPITLLRCLPEFILGTLLYSAFRAAPKNALLERDIAAFGILAAIVICLHVDAPDLLITCLFAALLLAAVLNTGTFSRIANVALLVWLGQISYSLYLLHGFVQFLTTKLLAGFGVNNHADLSIHNSMVLMILMVAVCLLAAHCTYFSIEIGCRRYLRNLFGAWGKKPPAVAAVRHTVPTQQTAG